jgi:hypothetical protein
MFPVDQVLRHGQHSHPALCACIHPAGRPGLGMVAAGKLLCCMLCYAMRCSWVSLYCPVIQVPQAYWYQPEGEGSHVFTGTYSYKYFSRQEMYIMIIVFYEDTGLPGWIDRSYYPVSQVISRCWKECYVA